MLDLSSRARERGEGRIREEAEGAREWWVMAVIAFIYIPTPPPTTHAYTPPAGVLVKFSTPYRLWQEVGSRALLSSSRFLAVVTSICVCICTMYVHVCK